MENPRRFFHEISLLGIYVGFADTVVMADIPEPSRHLPAVAGRVGRRVGSSCACCVVFGLRSINSSFAIADYFFGNTPEHAYIQPGTIGNPSQPT